MDLDDQFLWAADFKVCINVFNINFWGFSFALFFAHKFQNY